jgi:hypothetical protein
MNLVSFVKRNHKLIFYGAWLAMNFIQAAATELLDDEAYYWIYSNFLDWGYYDHPPMIALFIKAGTLVFPGELGVRAFIVVINIATLYIIQSLLEKKNDLLFYGIVLSLAIAQVGGIIAAPDLPLLFFTALFFLLYKRFTQQMNFLNTVLLGINIAFMLYSKYHGVLIVLFTLLSNIKLFTKYQTYVAGLLALAIFAPHLYWQYTHDFPSLQYHLVERNATHYRPTYTFEYLLSQILLAGPLLGWLFLWTAFKHKPITVTERALKFSMIGFYVFFLLSTIKGRVEANWTVPVIVALLVLSHQYIYSRPVMQKWLFSTVMFSLALVLAFRVYVVMDIAGPKWLKKDEFHQNKTWAAALKSQSRGLPLVSICSYQQASKYWFYAGVVSYSLNTPNYRRNNFNYWPVSDSLLGKTVYAIGYPDPNLLPEKVKMKGGVINGGAVIDTFFSFSKLQFNDIEEVVASNGTISLKCKLRMPAHYLPVFQQSPYNKATVQIAILNEHSIPDYHSSAFRVSDITATDMDLSLSFPVKLPKGKYAGRLATESRISYHPTLNSATFKFEVK